MKNSNEITVKITCGLDEIYKILDKRKHTITDRFTMDDIFMIHKDLKLNELSTREILSKAILIRNVTGDVSEREFKAITFKMKEFDNEGNIIKQSSINCEVLDLSEAKKLLEAIGYIELMRIKENDIVYEIDNVPLVIKDIVDGDKLIEIETDDVDGLRTIEELKESIKKLNIPIDTSNFFVKKAEIELNKVLKR